MGYKSKGIAVCKLCGGKVVARLLCRPCYEKEKRLGRIETHNFMTPKDAFILNISKKDSGCWEWQGTRNDYGYGIFLLPGEQKIRAHRFSYELWNGKIEGADTVVMHSCDNPCCVNPDHLSLGTRLENNRDAYKKNRRAVGEKSHLSRITEEQAYAIKHDPRKQKIIASEYGVGQDQVSRIKNGKQWKHLK